MLLFDREMCHVHLGGTGGDEQCCVSATLRRWTVSQFSACKQITVGLFSTNAFIITQRQFGWFQWSRCALFDCCSFCCTQLMSLTLSSTPSSLMIIYISDILVVWYNLDNSVFKGIRHLSYSPEAGFKNEGSYWSQQQSMIVSNVTFLWFTFLSPKKALHF